MSLSAKNKYKLNIAMGSSAAADALLAKLASDSALSARELRELEIALADKKAAAEINSDLQKDIAADQAAVAAAKATLDADKIALDAAQATYDGTPSGPNLAALNAAKATFAADGVIYQAALATLASDRVSARSNSALDIAMASESGGDAVQSEIEA